jgi:hypothetical protein
MRKWAIAAAMVCCWAGAASAVTVGETLVESMKQSNAVVERAFSELANALDRCNQEKRPVQRDECFTNLAKVAVPHARSAAEGAHSFKRKLDEMYPNGAEGVVTPKQR